MKVLPLLFIAVVAFLTNGPAAYAAVDSINERRSLDAAGLRNPAHLGYELSRTFLSEEEWSEQVASVQRKFHDWEKDNDGDMGRYLNDRFLIVALGAVGGDIEKIKKGVVWLAFYKEFNQPAPGLVTLALKKHHNSIARLLKDFSWAQASLYIKNKEWRKDTEEKKLTAAPSADEKGS